MKRDSWSALGVPDSGVVRPALAVLVCMANAAAAPPPQTFPVSIAVEAEDFDTVRGAGIDGWATDLRGCGNGDWVGYDSIFFPPGGYDSIAFTTISLGTLKENHTRPGYLTVRLDSWNGAVVATCTLSVRHHSWTRWRVPLKKTVGVHALFVLFSSDRENDTVCRLNRIELSGRVNKDDLQCGDVYVDGEGGADTNDGETPQTAFRTLSRATRLLGPGATCRIRGGVYRERLQPVMSGGPGAPVTFTACNGEDVYISAAEPVTGWKRHEGAIYVAPIDWNLGRYNNCVFVDGEIMYSARCPNVEDPCPEVGWDSYSTPCLEKGRQWIHPLLVPSWANTKYWRDDFVGPDDPDTVMTQTLTGRKMSPCFQNRDADFFKGGLFKGFRWWYFTNFGEVLSSDPTGTTPGDGIRFAVRRNPCIGVKSHKGPFYISHKRELLDSPREWYMDDGRVYLWAPDGDSPDEHLVEVKKRQQVALIQGLSHIVIENLRFLGGALVLRNARFCRIENCRFKYTSQYETWEESWEAGWASTNPGQYGDFRAKTFADGHRGIYIGGEENVISRCLIGVSAGSGIILDGKNCTVENCIIRDCNYAGTYDAGIYFTNGRRYDRGSEDAYWGTGHRIANNSFRGFGRSAIHFNSSGQAINENPITITGNDFQYRSLLSKEGGAIYVYGGGGPYTEITHNWFHEISGKTSGIIGLDNGAKHFRIHHNVFWRGTRTLHDASVFCNICADHAIVADNLVWNNTFIESNHCSENVDPGCSKARNVDWIGCNALYAMGEPEAWGIADAANHNFTLTAGSRAIDAGMKEVVMDMRYRDTDPETPTYDSTLYTGIMLNDYEGDAPDLGAYEYGRAPWPDPGAQWEEEEWEYPPNRTSMVQYVSFGGEGSGPSVITRKENLFIAHPLSSGSYTVSLFDVRGRMVRHVSVERRSVVVPLKELVPGMYLFRISGAIQTHFSYLRHR